MNVILTGKSFVEFMNLAGKDTLARPYTQGLIIDHEGNLWGTDGICIAVLGKFDVNTTYSNTFEWSFISREYLDYLGSLIKSSDLVVYNCTFRTLTIINKANYKDYLKSSDENLIDFVRNHSSELLVIDLVNQKVISPIVNTELHFKGYTHGNLPDISKCVRFITKSETVRPFDPVRVTKIMTMMNCDFSHKNDNVSAFCGVTCENCTGTVKFTRTDGLMTVWLSEVKV